MRSLIVTAIVLLAGPVQAAASQQFDLICESTAESKLPSTTHLRVDLGAMEWCSDECNMVRKVRDVTSDYIRFQKPESDAGWRYAVSRIDGKGTMSNPQVPLLYDEFVCHKAPFSGFPKAAF